MNNFWKNYFFFFFVDKLEKELRVRDDIIHELEVRLTLPPNNEDMLNGRVSKTVKFYTLSEILHSKAQTFS